MNRIELTAGRLRKGDRIVEAPIWPEGRLVTEVGHGTRDGQVRVTFEGAEEPHVFYDAGDRLAVMRNGPAPDPSFDDAITEYYEDRAASGLAALSR